MAGTFTWKGNSASATDARQWTRSGARGPNDPAIITAGGVLLLLDAQLNGATREVSSAMQSFAGDGVAECQHPDARP